MAEKNTGEETPKKGSFRDMIVITVVVVVCFALTLYGIIYLTGKVFNPEEEIEMQTNKYATTATDPEEGDILTFALEDNDTVIKGEDTPEAPAPVEPAPAPQVEKPQEVAKPVEVAPAPKPVVEAPKPAPTPAPAKPATQASNSAPKGKYVVQLLASKSEKGATEAAQKYQSACPDIHIRKVDLGDKGIWFRVRCGVTDSKSTADATKARLEKSFGIKPQVVANK